MADAPSDAGWLGAGLAAAGVAVGAMFTWLGQRLTGRAAQTDATTRRFEALFEAQADTIQRMHDSNLAERQTYRELIERREVAWSKERALLQAQITALSNGDRDGAERLRLEASMSALVILPPTAAE